MSPNSHNNENDNKELDPMQTGLATSEPTEFRLSGAFTEALNAMAPLTSSEVYDTLPNNISLKPSDPASSGWLVYTFDDALKRTAEPSISQAGVIFDSNRSIYDQALELGQMDNGKTLLVTPAGIICENEKGEFIALSADGTRALGPDSEHYVKLIQNDQYVVPQVPVNFYNPGLQDTAYVLDVQNRLSALMEGYRAHISGMDHDDAGLRQAFSQVNVEPTNPVIAAIAQIAPAPEISGHGPGRDLTAE